MVSQEVFDVFNKALKGKQLLTYSGVFKDALKLFNNGELDKYKESDLTEYIYALEYHWQGKNYSLIEKRLLTDEEKSLIKKQLVEELEVE